MRGKRRLVTIIEAGAPHFSSSDTVARADAVW